VAVSPEKVLQDLKNNQYSPVYFLQGEEPYYIDLIADYIEKNCLSESDKGFNQTILYGKDAPINVILNNARRFPMMSERQVVIVKEAQDIPDLGKDTGEKMLEAYLNNPLPSTVLVFCHKYKTLDGRKALGKSIDKKSILVTTKKMYDNQLPDWIEAYFRQKNFKINPRAASIIAESIGNDLSRLTNEADKLLINVKPGTEIGEELIEKYIGISKDYNVFELQKAIIQRDVVKANKIINYFEANPKNNPIIPIISVLFSFYSKLILAHTSDNKSESNLAKVLGVNPYFAKDYIKAAGAYPLPKVIQIIGFLKTADLQSKGVNNVSTTEGQILKELIFKILH